MRRLIGPGLVGLGVFLVVGAALIRFYAYPALAKVPANYESTTHLAATDAEVLDFETYEPETHDLTVTSVVREDAHVSAPAGDVVWVSLLTVERDDGSTFQQSTERAAFDEVTGAAADCEKCETGEEVAEDDWTAVDYDGQIYKFPFDTQPHDYRLWDGTLGEATTAAFMGETEVRGLTVYKFVQVIEPRVVEMREVPGSMFDSGAAAVDAEMVYGMTRTLYIEPATGSPVHRVEERVQELQYDGRSVPVFSGTVAYTDDEVEGNVDDLGSKATLLGGMRTAVPLGMVLVGAVALAIGLTLSRRHAVSEGGADRPDRSLVTA